MSHVFEAPYPREGDDLSPVLRGEGENENKTGAKRARTIWRSYGCAEALSPLAVPPLPRKLSPGIAALSQNVPIL